MEKIYVVENGIFTEAFPTYRAAELYCAERGIHPENIYEENAEDWEWVPIIGQ